MVRAVEVALLRDVPEERRLSMEAYADQLERAFEGSPAVRVRGVCVHQRGDRLGSYAARFVRYPFVARRLDADLFHIADHGYAYLAAVLPASRTVVTCHDLMLLRGEEGAAGFRGRRSAVIRFRWTASYLRRAAHVFCPSHATADDVERLVGVTRQRISVVPHGLPAHFRRLPAERRETVRAGLPAAAHLVLHVSSGHAYKNTQAVLRTVAALRREGLDAALIRAGRPLQPAERALAGELGLAVHELGIVSDERLVELYNACDALLFPSFLEGFGWPVLEAMRCGLPVVVSTTPALLELVGDAGATAAAEDVGALATALRELLGSPTAAADASRRGLARAEQFSWEKAAAGYAEVYARLAG